MLLQHRRMPLLQADANVFFWRHVNLIARATKRNTFAVAIRKRNFKHIRETDREKDALDIMVSVRSYTYDIETQVNLTKRRNNHLSNKLKIWL